MQGFIVLYFIFYLIYSVVPISAVQKNDSVIHIRILFVVL